MTTTCDLAVAATKTHMTHAEALTVQKLLAIACDHVARIEPRGDGVQVVCHHGGTDYPLRFLVDVVAHIGQSEAGRHGWLM